jgi:hypothetical protein
LKTYGSITEGPMDFSYLLNYAKITTLFTTLAQLYLFAIVVGAVVTISLKVSQYEALTHTSLSNSSQLQMIVKKIAYFLLNVLVIGSIGALIFAFAPGEQNELVLPTQDLGKNALLAFLKTNL